jgi:hypothetical protein
MTMADVEAALPWGLHDALLESIEIDWPNARASLTVRVMIAEGQDLVRRGKVTVSGLVFCSIDPRRSIPRVTTCPFRPMACGSMPARAPRTTR